MVFGKLLPRDGNFFELFDQHGAHIGAGARAFLSMVQNYADHTLREKYTAEISAAEHAADRITASVHRALHKSFITPLDRDQILRLIDAMDDVLDMLQDTSEVMSLYDLQRVSDDVVRPGSRISDTIRVSGLGRTPVKVQVELFGPFASRAAMRPEVKAHPR